MARPCVWNNDCYSVKSSHILFTSNRDTVQTRGRRTPGLGREWVGNRSFPYLARKYYKLGPKGASADTWFITRICSLVFRIVNETTEGQIWITTSLHSSVYERSFNIFGVIMFYWVVRGTTLRTAGNQFSRGLNDGLIKTWKTNIKSSSWGSKPD